MGWISILGALDSCALDSLDLDCGALDFLDLDCGALDSLDLDCGALDSLDLEERERERERERELLQGVTRIMAPQKTSQSIRGGTCVSRMLTAASIMRPFMHLGYAELCLTCS